MLEIERVLALREQEDLKLKQQEKEKLKDSWNDSIKHKNMQLNEEKKEKNTFIHTSLSGAQPMHGEDDNQSIRIKAQQEQIRLDYQKSLSEHDDAKKRNQLIELGFAQMDQYSYEIRTKTEENEIEARRKANIDVREQNSEVRKVIKTALAIVSYIY